MEESTEIWAIVELMGHVKYAGRLSEVERFGAKLGRIDMPIEGQFVTKFFGGQSVYCITPVTEQVARHVCRSIRTEPVQPWDFPKGLPVARDSPANDDDDYNLI